MGKIIQGNFGDQKQKKKMSPKNQAVAAYQLKVSLLYTEPLVWRCIQVLGNLQLSRLHDILQLCMGWTDTHLHQFVIGNNIYGPLELDDDWGEMKSLDESRFTLNDLEADIRKRCIYQYDFGDNWEHEIRIEKVVSSDKKVPDCPVLLGGEHACPPEDVGGTSGYQHFLAAINDLEDEDHEDMQSWYGADNFDADFFAMDEINTILKKMK